MAILLGGCGDQLALEAAGTAPVSGPTVQVRTRAVCGNGVVEPGEACDDGNAVADGTCAADCQRPCAAGEVELTACGPGPTLRVEGTVERDDGTRVSYVEQQETVQCSTAAGGSVTLKVCQRFLEPPHLRDTFAGCLNPLLPAAGDRLCAHNCERGCPAGTTCLAQAGAEAGPDAGTDASASSLCVPSIGGGLSDECGACGEGLSCNGITGYTATCMPTTCAAGCPPRAFCRPGFDVLTGALQGETCFLSPAYPLGTRIDASMSALLCAGGLMLPWYWHDETCRLGCARLLECSLTFGEGQLTYGECVRGCRSGAYMGSLACVNRSSSCDPDRIAQRCEQDAQINAPPSFYCTQISTSGCPSGWQPGAVTYPDLGTFQVCLAPGPGVYQAPPLPGERVFPDPRCPEDTDLACTYASTCDPDCARPLGCGPVSPLGVCDGPVLDWCDRGRVTRLDCAARGLRCAFDAEQARYDCLEVR